MNWQGDLYPISKWEGLELKVALDELAEFLAVFVLHMDEFDAVAVRTDIANNSREMNFAKPGTNFQLDGITYVQLLWGLEIGATQADGLYPSESGRALFNLCAQWGIERNSGVTPWNDEACV